VLSQQQYLTETATCGPRGTRVYRHSPGPREALIPGAGFPSDIPEVLAGEIVSLADVRAAQLWSNLHDE
jgi:hypothetical protein